MEDIDKLTYEQAVAELDSILAAIQSDKCDIDRLSEMTRRATALLAACRGRLTATEAELKDILAKLQEQ